MTNKHRMLLLLAIPLAPFLLINLVFGHALEKIAAAYVIILFLIMGVSELHDRGGR